MTSMRQPASSLIVAFLFALTAVAAGPAVAQESDDNSGQKSAKQEARQHLDDADDAYHEGQWFEARKAYKKAYQAAPAESAVRVEAALGRSTLLWEQGEYDASSEYIGEALDLAKRLEIHGAVGRLLLTLGHTQASQGRLGQAEGTLESCVKLAAEQDDPVFGPLCKVNRRLVRKLQGKDIGADRDYKQALQKLESADSPLTAGLSLAKTAELYADGGQRGRAFDLLDRADKQYDKAGSVPAKARNRLLQARLLQESGKWDAARSKLEGLAGKFESMGSKPALFDVLGLLGNDSQHRKAFDEARQHYDRALELAKATGSPQLVAKGQAAVCDLGGSTGDASVDAHCRESAETFTELGMPKMAAQVHASRGRLAQATSALEKARDQFLTARDILDKKVHPRLREESHRRNIVANLCQVEMKLGAEGAHYRCRQALEALDGGDAGPDSMVASTRYALGNTAAKAGSLEEGIEQLEKAAEMFASMESPNFAMYGDTQLRLGTIHQKAGDRDKATEAFEQGVEKLREAGNESLLTTLVQLRSQYAQAELRRENWETAAEQLPKVAEEAKTIGDMATRAWSYSALARAESKLGDDEAAREALETALPLAKESGDEKLVETVEGNLEEFSD
jgi:tetratricopeptide (TPR) repeat protein